MMKAKVKVLGVVALLWFLSALIVFRTYILPSYLIDHTESEIGISHTNSKTSITDDFAQDSSKPLLSSSSPSPLTTVPPLTTPTSATTDIVIAIPSAIRNTAHHPLESLLDPLLKDLENQVTSTTTLSFSQIVVMNVEIPAESHAVISQLEKKYNEFIERGKLVFFSHDNEQLKLYQRLLNASTIKKNYGDGLTRILWRSKENLDFAHVLKRACAIEDKLQQSSSTKSPKYVLFLEDDTIPTSNMMQKLINWLQTNKYEQRDDQWFVLSFYNPDRADIPDGDEYYVGCCTQAMLFQCRDVPQMASYAIANFDEKPVDWLLSGYFLERKNRDNRKSYVKVPNLFQHMRVISSFASKGITGHQSLSFVS